MKEENTNKKSESAIREERILEFWKENNIFENSLEKESPKGEFVFFEGPPTANGKPGIHHLEARAFKDAIPRYKTMQGFHVRRKGGWDTHGLPVELQVEKILGLKSKREIESYGIAEFNKKCKENVWEYVDVWRKFTERIGYWIDQKNPYVTYENNYIESVWNILKKVDEQDLLYKDYKVVPWCPRCGTVLSSHELAQGYQDDKDLSVTAKFKIKGVENGYFLAWTTTPWTLPGNVALAVGNDIVYVEAKVPARNASGIADAGGGDEILVLAKDRLSVITDPYEIVAEHKGSEMVGMEYEPLYPYLAELNKGDEKLKNAYKVYSADFVNIEDGTGIVHTAVMYGQDDFELGTKVGLPKYHLVDEAGNFVKGTGFLEGRFVKAEETDVEIIKDLAHRNLLFKKEKYVHSYPHCWRCGTALIYYARDSWYIRMSDRDVKEKLISENKEINWEPAHIREGRFGEWLAEVKDWAISRERYWGTPLPIWETKDEQKNKKIIVIDSIGTLKKYTEKSGNKYFVIRHGEADHNLKGLSSADPKEPVHLTEKGREQVAVQISKMKEAGVDLVIASPFVRTRETAEIIHQGLGLATDALLHDERLREIDIGVYNGGTWKRFHDDFPKTAENFDIAPEGGESYNTVKSWMMDFIHDVEIQYKNRNILIVTHGAPAWLLMAGTLGYDAERSLEMVRDKKDFHYFENADVMQVPYIPFPHNDRWELDLHRPFIDQTQLIDADGRPMNRVKEVLDVWFDSGSMPFAQDHFPFEKKDNILYPADYICEAVDQTRGWFYTLHAIGALMNKGKAYKNVICLGLLLDKDGKKMSKSLGNVVDPWEMMEKYGVDTLRLWMYSVNQPGDSKNFDEKTVAELHNKVFNLLYNVLAFYELYRDKSLEEEEYPGSKNILDQWMLARLGELTDLVTKNMDSYKLLEPTRAIREFIDDLSTWYLRRSRDRIKEEAANPAKEDGARQTLYFVLKNLAKLMAPFAPFSAEDIWLKLKRDNGALSVHLCEWPKVEKFDKDIINAMKITREICNVGNMLRKKTNIPIRQPLATLYIPMAMPEEHKQIIKEELNIKNIQKGKDKNLIFDTEITAVLKQEGNYRELVRAVQDMRKEMKLTPSDTISLAIKTDNTGEELIKKFERELLKTVGAKEIEFSDIQGTEVKIEGLIFQVKISK